MRDQHLRGTRSVISATFMLGSVPTDSTSPVTIEVLREDGTVLVPAGTATVDATPGDGKYEYALSAANTAQVDVLTARWTATLAGAVQTLTTVHEIVGGFYFSLYDLRQMPGIGNASVVSDETLARTHQEVAELIERVCGASFVPRYDRVILDGTGTDSTWLPKPYVQEVLSLKVDGVAYTSDELADLSVYDYGRIQRKTLGIFTTGVNNVAVRYVHGYKHMDGSAPPADLVRAGLTLARAKLLADRNSLPDRAVTHTGDFGTVTLAQPGPNRPTGYPEVDAVLMGWRDQVRVPVVA